MHKDVAAQQTNRDTSNATEINDLYEDNSDIDNELPTATDSKTEYYQTEPNIAYITAESAIPLGAADYLHSFNKQISRVTARQHNGDVARNVPAAGVAKGNNYEGCESTDQSDQHNGNEIWYK